jgi:hypothetical protein
MVNVINFTALGDAMGYYKTLGYEIKEVPWLVPFSDIMITIHENLKPTKISSLFPNDYLVGSAEQSFLNFHRNKKIEINKKYIGCTPCFRHESVIDKYHQLYFMKAELYLPLSYEDKEEDKENIFKNIINDAKYFFEHYDFLNRSQILNTEKIRTTKVVKTDFGFDIELNGIELGSYGIRRNQENKLLWIHGTGLAEPRFSNVVNEKLT